MGFWSDTVGPLLSGVGKFIPGPIGVVANLAGGLISSDETTTKTNLQSAATAITGGTPKKLAGPAVAQVLRTTVAPTAVALAGAAAMDMPETVVTIGGMKNVVTTIIQTRDPSGRVIKTETRKGRPFLMKQDLVIAKRVFKTVRKAGEKLPKKTVRPSRSQMLKEQIVDVAMQKLITGPSCPPKC